MGKQNRWLSLVYYGLLWGLGVYVDIKASWGEGSTHE